MASSKQVTTNPATTRAVTDAPTTATTMQAIEYDSYGSPEVLQYRQVSRPKPRPGQVLVEVKAAGVNPADWHMMTGTPLPVRLMGTGLLKPKTGRLGIDVAGVIAAVGEGVSSHAVGDRVYGAARGCYGEYVVTDADRVNPLPESMTMEQGGGVAVAAVTAIQGLRDKIKVQPGQHILINGASGGVGTFAVQIAKLLGAEVTGVCSGRNVELVRSLGADHVVDYTSDDFTARDVRYDGIFDNVGSHSFTQYCRVLEPDAVVVMVGGEKGGMAKMIYAGLKTVAQSLRASQKATMFVADENATELAVLHEWFAAGELTTVIDRTYPLDQAAEAMHYIATQRAQGKVVLIP